MVDVVIVGAGIAGLVLSILLQRRGIEPIVIDRLFRGRDPLALGETLPPSAIPLLRSLHLGELFHHHALRKTRGYHLSWGHEDLTHTNFYVQSPQAYGLKLDKQSLLQGLKTLAGSIRYSDRSITLIPNPAGVFLHTTLAQQTATISAKIVVDATGRNRALIKQILKQDIQQNDNAIERHDRLLAFSCHLPRIYDLQLPHGVLIESFEQGWGIVSDLSLGHCVLSLFTYPHTPIAPLLKTYCHWPDILAKTHWLKRFLAPTAGTPVLSADASTSKSILSPETKVLAIGDAIVAFDPLSSHGITNAIFTASEAARVIEQYLSTEQWDVLRQYQTKMDRIFAAYKQTRAFLYRREARWPSSPFWCGFWPG